MYKIFFILYLEICWLVISYSGNPPFNTFTVQQILFIMTKNFLSREQMFKIFLILVGGFVLTICYFILTILLNYSENKALISLIV